MRGKKTGGRQKGIPNKAPSKAALAQAVAKVAVGEGISPLEYMLGIMRDPLANPERRDDMAKAAAPYLHAKLASVEHSGPGGGAIPLSIGVRFVNPDGSVSGS